VTAGQPLYTVDSPAAAAAVKKAQSDVDGYEKQIKTLQKDIAGLNLAAGYPGKLMEVATLNPGDTITKGQEVATLSDDTRLRLEQYYSYAYAGQIKTGQSVQVSVPALMTTLTGRIEAVHMVTRITPEGSKLFEADIVVTNPGTLTADMAASATVAAGGETAYPYEASKLKYYRTGKLTSTVDGTVISSDLVNYLQVKEGQVLVRISGEDSESQLFTLQQSLSDAQKSLDDAKKNQANCSAVAPIDGTVIGLALQSGAEVAANTAAITIADTTTIMIDATVDERNVSYVKAGTPVNITDWSGNTYSGMVETVSLTSKVENGVASYPMTISLDNSAGTIMVGSNVNYSLVASQNDNCLVLPLQAVKYVQLDDGTTGTVVFVKADSKPDGAIDLTTPVDGVPEGYWPVPVEIGISDNYNVEIKSGAEEGTTVFDSVQTTSSFG
jgi:multidrug resistance efflux pump